MIARQFIAVFNLSLRRILRSRLIWINLFLALIPLVIVILIVYFDRPGELSTASHKLNHVHDVYENLLRSYFLHFMVFFIANVLGFAIVRQEADDQTLHYLYLQPVGRWLLIVGKLAAYLLLSSAACIASLWLCYSVLMLGWLGIGEWYADLFHNGRALILFKESLTLLLGLLAYGSLAMMMGCIFKSNVIYGVLLLGWETLLPYLPMVLKMWTIMHYLQSLMPERLDQQRELIALLGEPASVALSLTVLFGISLLTLATAVIVYHFKECTFAEA